uniref:Uncharacterized protein n=1 Tax=Branchiostoma floridae TaxID=7739 RepID=C3YHF7_BRAFL|eukprot:XP_002604382.1 hypothetical protein BRAFLDRAFT_73368 [Branchiostoma floridae]
MDLRSHIAELKETISNMVEISRLKEALPVSNRLARLETALGEKDGQENGGRPDWRGTRSIATPTPRGRQRLRYGERRRIRILGIQNAFRRRQHNDISLPTMPGWGPHPARPLAVRATPNWTNAADEVSPPFAPAQYRSPPFWYPQVQSEAYTSTPQGRSPLGTIQPTGNVKKSRPSTIRTTQPNQDNTERLLYNAIIRSVVIRYQLTSMKSRDTDPGDPAAVTEVVHSAEGDALIQSRQQVELQTGSVHVPDGIILRDPYPGTDDKDRVVEVSLTVMFQKLKAQIETLSVVRGLERVDEANVQRAFRIEWTLPCNPIATATANREVETAVQIASRKEKRGGINHYSGPNLMTDMAKLCIDATSKTVSSLI